MFQGRPMMTVLSAHTSRQNNFLSDIKALQVVLGLNKGGGPASSVAAIRSLSVVFARCDEL